MNEQLKDFKLRLDSWTEEGRKLLADMNAADDGSIEINDMQDVIINGLGMSYPAPQDRGSLDSASSISLDISGAAISTCNGAGGGLGGVWSGGSIVSNELKPKIKLTKTLPSQSGSYYWVHSAGDEMEILDVEECMISGKLCVNISASIGVPPVDELGGYWAKVEQDHFEFED